MSIDNAPVVTAVIRAFCLALISASFAPLSSRDRCTMLRLAKRVARTDWRGCGRAGSTGTWAAIVMRWSRPCISRLTVFADVFCFGNTGVKMDMTRAASLWGEVGMVMGTTALAVAMKAATGDSVGLSNTLIN